MIDSCPPHHPKDPKAYDRYDAVSYTPFPGDIPLARRHVAQLAVDWGHPNVAADAALLAGELCTNALLHGCLRDRPFRVETSLSGTALRVAVTDPRGERLPYSRASAADDQFGRGLLIVRTLADRWAVEKLTVGKTIWAELDIRGDVDASAEPPAKVPQRYLRGTEPTASSKLGSTPLRPKQGHRVRCRKSPGDRCVTYRA